MNQNSECERVSSKKVKETPLKCIPVEFFDEESMLKDRYYGKCSPVDELDL